MTRSNTDGSADEQGLPTQDVVTLSDLKFGRGKGVSPQQTLRLRRRKKNRCESLSAISSIIENMSWQGIDPETELGRGRDMKIHKSSLSHSVSPSRFKRLHKRSSSEDCSILQHSIQPGEEIFRPIQTLVDAAPKQVENQELNDDDISSLESVKFSEAEFSDGLSIHEDADPSLDINLRTHPSLHTITEDDSLSISEGRRDSTEATQAPNWIQSQVLTLVEVLLNGERDFLNNLLRVRHCVSEPLRNSIALNTLCDTESADIAGKFVKLAESLTRTHRSFFNEMETILNGAYTSIAKGDQVDIFITRKAVDILMWHGPALGVLKDYIDLLPSLRKLLQRCCLECSVQQSLLLVMVPLRRFGNYIEFAEELCEYVTSAKERHLLEVWLCDAIEVDDSAQMETGRLRQLDLLQTLQSSLPNLGLENDDNPLIRYDDMRDINTNDIFHLILFGDSLLVCSSSVSCKSLWKLEQRWSVDEIKIEPESFENGKDGAIILTSGSFGPRGFRASCILNKLCFLHDLRQTIERAKAAYKPYDDNHQDTL